MMLKPFFVVLSPRGKNCSRGTNLLQLLKNQYTQAFNFLLLHASYKVFGNYHTFSAVNRSLKYGQVEISCFKLFVKIVSTTIYSVVKYGNFYFHYWISNWSLYYLIL